MCLRQDPLDSEESEIQLEYQRGLLAHLPNALDIPNASSSISNSGAGCSLPTEMSHHGDEALDPLEIRIELGCIDENNSQSPQTPSLVAGCKANNVVKNLFKIMGTKFEEVAQKLEHFKDELLLTLVGVTGQNAVQMSLSLSSSSADQSGHWNIAMAANCTAFLSLLSGLILRSRSGRGQQVGNILVLLGILLTVAGPVFDLSMNIPGVGGYLVPIACLLPFIGALT